MMGQAVMLSRRYRQIQMRSRLATLMIAVTVLVCTACSHKIAGTPVAAPGEAGKTGDPAELITTTCREYLEMDDDSRYDVIMAIGQDDNQLVAINPNLWVGVAGALCSFVDPRAPVRDIIMGTGQR